MTSLTCVCAAGLIHLMHDWTLTTDPSNVSGPQLPSLFVSFALMDLIYDNRLIPQGLRVMPVVLQRIYELAVTLLLLELGMHVIWKPLERVIHLATKVFLLGMGLVSEEVFQRHDNFWLGCVTMPLSLLILAFVGQATDHFHLLRKQSVCVQTKVRLNVDATLRFLRRHQKATGIPMPQYAEKLQRYKDAATRRRRG
ncbi:hypothetical protein KR054_011324, partial [Drosophila jambulina]